MGGEGRGKDERGGEGKGGERRGGERRAGEWLDLAYCNLLATILEWDGERGRKREKEKELEIKCAAVFFRGIHTSQSFYRARKPSQETLRR